MKTPILGSAYVARSVNAADNRMVNLFPEILPEGNKEPAFLNRAPGLRLVHTIGSGPVRGLWSFGGNLYTVSGQELYKVDAEPVTVESDGSWAEGPDDCGIASVSDITGSATITLVVTSDGYQFTVGDETWPEAPAPWSTIFAGSPHAFTLATLTFDETPPHGEVDPVGTCDPNAAPLTGTYTTLATPFSPIYCTAIAGNATKILAVGGADGMGGAYHSSAALYDIGTGIWTVTTDLPVALGTEGEQDPAVLLSISEEEFLLIGWNYAYTFNIAAETWTLKTGLSGNHVRNRFAAVYDGADSVYVVGGLLLVGGVGASSAAGTAVLMKYSILDDNWTVGPAGDDDYKCANVGAALHNGSLYVAGWVADPFFGYAHKVVKRDLTDFATGGWTVINGIDPTNFGSTVAATGEGVYLTQTGTRMSRVDLTDDTAAVLPGWDTLSFTEPVIFRAGTCDLYVLGYEAAAAGAVFLRLT